MSDVASHVRTRALRGLRWVFVLNATTAPLSFVTNMILGRLSALALGYYGAINIFVGSFRTFFVFGGPQVFTQFVPPMREDRRLSFLASYVALTVGMFGCVWAAGFVAWPSGMRWLLSRFGDPPLSVAVALALTVTIWSFSLSLLYGMLEAPRASVTVKSIVIGFLGVAALGLGPLRSVAAEHTSAFVWYGAVAVYLGGCVVGVWNLGSLRGRLGGRRPTWFLPDGFWRSATFAHLGTIVAFVYTTLSPMLVLLWLDVASLARVYAALRYAAMLRLVPGMVSDVIAPGLAALTASGHREGALRQAATAIRASMLFTTPVSLALIFLAGDAMAVFRPEFREARGVMQILGVSGLAGPLIQIGNGMAAAFGALGAYLVASIVYVTVALGLAVALIPPYGVVGAALAMSLGAVVQQVCVAVVLRSRLGFRIPGRVYAAWGVGIVSCAVALRFDPGRLAGAGLLVAALLAFAALGRVTPTEIRSLATRMARRSEAGGSDGRRE